MATGMAMGMTMTMAMIMSMVMPMGFLKESLGILKILKGVLKGSYRILYRF